MKSSEVDDDGELTGIRRSFNVEVICSPLIEDGTSHNSHESPRPRNFPSPWIDVREELTEKE
jgi:hypothetical protein